MKIRNKAAFLVLAMMTEIALSSNPALADRFYVALVLPLSSDAALQGRQIREGFMLATTERDSHPGEESDGHLGGLDVYVSVIDARGDVAADIGRIVAQGEVDILAAFGPEETHALIEKLLEGTKMTLLRPGQTPFVESDLPAVADFISAYEKEYGSKPSPQAAQGYNAARRIDLAVRAQGGVGDRAALLRVFRETARGIPW